MDFRSMKRKELQALCKKHKIPANLSNLEMANKLTEFFKEKKNSLVQGLIKEQDEIVSETETANVVMDRKVSKKKVRFSPEHELIEFTRSQDIKRRSRRNSVSGRESSLYVENVDASEMNNENVGNLGRVTRSRGLKLMESEVNDKKRGTNGVKRDSQKNNIAAVENFKNGEFLEDDVDKPGPVIQLRGKTLVQGVKNASKRRRKRAKDDDKADKKALDNANDEKLIEEIVDIPGRLTRSRGKKLMKDSKRKDKRRKIVENNDNAALARAETNDIREVSMKSVRTGGIAGEGERVKQHEKGWKEEVLETTKIGGVHVMVEPQILLRRSERNMNGARDSEILNDDTRKHEYVEMEGLRKTPKLLAVEGSGVDAKSTGSKVDLDGGIALRIEEPNERGVRRSSRRKNVTMSHEDLENGELKEETENRYPLRSSVPQIGTDKDDKKVLQPTGVTRRSRRKISSLELVPDDETINTNAAVEKFETENHLSKPCPVPKESPAVWKNTRRSRRNASINNQVEILAAVGDDSTIQQKNEARKRKRGPSSEGDVIKNNDDSNSPMQSTRKESRSEKAVPAAATGKVSGIREPPSRLKEPNMLDASSRENLLEIGQSFADAQFSLSEGAESIKNGGLGSDTNGEAIISEVRLTSSRKIYIKKQGISTADSGRNADARLIYGTELANSDKYTAARIAELKTDCTDTEKQISDSKFRGEEKVNSLSEFDVKELIEENISDTEKNDTAAQVFSQTEDSRCDNTIDHQLLLEGSIVSGNTCFTGTNYSADSLLPGDQTNFKSGQEAAEAEVDKQAQPGLDVVDDEVKCVSVQEILESVETERTDAISPIARCHNDVNHVGSSNSISVSNYEDTSPKAGDAGAFMSCDGYVEPAGLKSALRLIEQSSGKLRGSLECDTAEGYEIYSHKGIDPEVPETDEGGYLKDHETGSNEDSKFYVPELYGERSARIIPQDRGHAVKHSENNYEHTSLKAGEGDAFKSCDGHVESTDLKGALQLEEPSSGNLRRSLEGDDTAAGDDIYSHKGIDSKVAENGEGGCSRDHETASNEGSESSVSRIIPQDRGHAVISSEENNKDDTSPKAGEVGVFESCDGQIESTDLKSALQLDEPSSGKLTRSLKGDNTAEGDQIYSHKGIDPNVADKDSEFIVPEPFDERSSRIIPQDRGYAVMNTDENRMYNDALALRPITISGNTSEIKLMGSHGTHHIAKIDETYNKSVHSEFVESDEGGYCRHHNSKCDEDVEYGVSNLFAAERSARIMPQDKEIFSLENSIKDFNKKWIFQDPEADQIAGAKTYLYNDIQSELGEADEGGCLKDQTSTKDEDWLFSVSNLFDSERSAPSMPQGSSSLHEIIPSKPNGVSESEGVMSTIHNLSEIIDKEAGSTDILQGIEIAMLQSKVPGDEVSTDKTISEGEREFLNQAVAHTNKDTCEPAKQPKSPVADSIQGQEAWSNGSETAKHALAVFKTNGKGKSNQVAQGSNTDEDANEANTGKDKEDFIDASITDISVSMYHTITKIRVENLNEFKFQEIKETEHQSKSPLARHTLSDVGEESSYVSSQSWTEYELNILFGATVDSVTPTKLNDTFCKGTETATLTKSVNDSVTSSARNLTKRKRMMVERGSKTTNKTVVLQPDYEEAADIGFSPGSKENQFKLLFATPVTIVAPCKVDETSAHEGKLDNAALFKECVGAMKENVVAQIKSDEKVGDSGNKFEYNLSVENSLPRNGEDVTSEELNQAEGVKLVNNCTTPVLSGGQYDGCKASEETNIITEENEEIIFLEQSWLYEEATDNHSEGRERDIISSSSALKNLDKVEGCNDLLMDTDLSENLSCESRSYLKSEGELAQSSEVALELPDAGFQEPRFPDNSRGYMVGNILKETSIDNSRAPMDPERANIGSFNGGKYAIDKGTSPSLFPKASYNDHEVATRKDANSIRVNDDPYHHMSDTQDETDTLSHDISDDLHTSNEAATLESLSVGFTLSQEANKLQNTLELQYKEANLAGITIQNADNVVPAADHGSSVYSAESDILSSVAMHLLLADNEDCDIEKSEARTPLLNLKDDAEKNGKKVEENPTEAIVRFSIPKLHLEEKCDSYNDIHTISDASTSRCNEILKESDVADTIQEYINSESSLSMDFEGSGASLPIDVLAHIDERSTCENAAVCESKESIDDKQSVDSVETESKELEESTLFMKPAPGPEEAMKSSPARIGSTANKPSAETKGSAVTATFLMSKEIETSSKQLHSTPKKNARTILIHGTPRKLLTGADMKENVAMRKGSNIGDFTTVRPAKRKALQDVKVEWR